VLEGMNQTDEKIPELIDRLLSIVQLGPIQDIKCKTQIYIKAEHRNLVTEYRSLKPYSIWGSCNMMGPKRVSFKNLTKASSPFIKRGPTRF
jgi:hypothetical protein